MKLYTKPGACSTADHIALAWSGLPYEVEVLDGRQLKSADYLAINPAGTVPTLVDGDFVLPQNAAILGYIADSAPAAALLGDGSARQRAEATRWLAFVNADLHPAFKPLFTPAAFIADRGQQDALKGPAHARLRGLYDIVDRQLEGRDWIAGFRSVADPYLFVTLLWAERIKLDLGGLDRVHAYRARLQVDPGVQAALAAEGLG